ncbi:MAG TPA: hypothetical protein VMT34_16975 [Aggregatilineales bacterium]|nr:hypothetical protein [Aggregatilineales bacterium]
MSAPSGTSSWFGLLFSSLALIATPLFHTAPIVQARQADTPEAAPTTEATEAPTEPGVNAPTPPSTLKGTIVYAALSDTTGGQEIFSINADGTGKIQLTHDAATDWYPVWSPDGKKIAYISSSKDATYHIYVMDADGSNSSQLTTTNDGFDGLSWSPDGKRIAFASMRDGNNEIYLMNADGSQAKNLSHNPANDRFPAWSPDGKRLIFISDRDDTTHASHDQLYIMNLDGTNVIRLTFDLRTRYGYPRYSPDGKLIAEVELHYQADGTYIDGGTYLLSLVTSKKARLSYDGTYDSGAWSPDGKYLVAVHRTFDAAKHVHTALEILGVDATERYVLVADGDPGVPAWSAN